MMRSVARLAVPQRQRSVIVPIGDTNYRRVGPHVEINIKNVGIYATFMINDVLGRLDCNAVPRLLYLKAHLHAYTSYIIPDSLTGRTGTEEALHCLASGYCQPWSPINSFPYESLVALARLTPPRNYYPKDRKVLHQPTWNPDLTISIQHDGFRYMIDNIVEKSTQLAIFSSDKVQAMPPILCSVGDSYLVTRAHRRRENFRRPNACLLNVEPQSDLVYSSRDTLGTGKSRNNVFHALHILRNWPEKIFTTNDLAGVLQNWPIIGGWQKAFDKIIISDLLATSFDTEWGSLVEFCRNAASEDLYRLMFLFGLMSFRDDAPMDMIRTLIAYSILEELKILAPPKWPEYLDFCYNKTPRSNELLEWIEPCLIAYPQDERSISEFNLAYRQIKQLKANQLAYEKQRHTEALCLISFLLPQWPCVEPSIADLVLTTTSLVDVNTAMHIVRRKWRCLYENHELSEYITQVQKVSGRDWTRCGLDDIDQIL